MGEYFVWRRQDLEGHANCLQIFAWLNVLSVAPAAITSKNGIMMIKANNNYNVSSYSEAATMIDALKTALLTMTLQSRHHYPHFKMQKKD